MNNVALNNELHPNKINAYLHSDIFDVIKYPVINPIGAARSIVDINIGLFLKVPNASTKIGW